MKKNKQSGTSTRWNSFHKNYNLLVPIQFAMLCDLLDLKIEDVLYDFMAAAGQESYSKGRKPEKSILKYFLQSGYGQGHYTRTDIRKIFSEFKAISELWPRSAETDIIARHSTWREMYYQYFHSKWFHKIRRKSPDGKVKD